VNFWLINHHANPSHEPGDARHYSHARELMRRGHEARIVACNFDHLQHKYQPMTAGKTWEHKLFADVPFTWITACSYQSNYEMARIRNMLEFAHRTRKGDWAAGLKAPDLILGSNPDPFAALAAERLAVRYGVPFVLEIRDPWPYVLTEVGGHSRYHPFVQAVDRIMRYLYARADRIVMFSRDSTELLTRYGADPKKIVWIPHGVDLSLYPEPSLAPNDGLFTVTYLGAHNRWNSLDAILDAAKLLQEAGIQDVLIRFVGDGVSKRALVERARVEQLRNVRFDDPVPKAEVAELMHSSDAFIINNRKDAVSRNWTSFSKTYDYLAAGRPVVSGSCAHNDPVREAGAGVTVDADTPAALAGAIEFLAGRTAEQLLEYGARGRKYIEENYNLPALVDRFEAMALEIVSERARQGGLVQYNHLPGQGC